jgi:GTP diphosphokinase / guanosine-3',5'-bis(diphosphate) 3'-diphosphatase
VKVFLISDLCDILEQYLDKDQVAEVYRAYLFGAEAHDGQRRRSGEPYIYHPIEVARILANLRVDYRSISAAILHDVIEDTGVTKEQLTKEFDEEIAQLVDGVSKLTHLKIENPKEIQAENFRKMMLAIAKDIRVILIKLADRLHNMRTIGALAVKKRHRIAHETLEIYAPIANRLGINSVRMELEDLGFSALYPLRSQALKRAISKAGGHRKEIVNNILNGILQRVDAENLSAEIFGREKHLFSLYKKMRNRHLSFNEIMDVYAFRIIVDNVSDCYRSLGLVHNLYKPVPGRFKDYIAIPKVNGYQSLHTVLIGPYGVNIEVQIRTRQMHEVAEHGIAAHWLYKTPEGQTSQSEKIAREWILQLLEVQKHAGNSLEFLDNVKTDLFPDEIYVFTPKGRILKLPKGATAVDFAYMVHTDVGNSCIAARINRQMSPLHTQPSNGQVVEIITSPHARPNPAWLDFIITAKARTSIRHFLKQQQTGEAVLLGRQILNNAVKSLGSSYDNITTDSLKAVLKELSYSCEEELFIAIGLGKRMAPIIAKQLLSFDKTLEIPLSSQPLRIMGSEGMVVKFGKCCHPIPNDRVIGFLSAGKGVVIHRQECTNIKQHLSHQEKWLEVTWDKPTDQLLPAQICVEVTNQRGVLANIATIIAKQESNIENIIIDEKDGINTAINIVVTVKNQKHLKSIIKDIRYNKNIMRAYRI